MTTGEYGGNSLSKATVIVPSGKEPLDSGTGTSDWNPPSSGTWVGTSVGAGTLGTAGAGVGGTVTASVGVGRGGTGSTSARAGVSVWSGVDWSLLTNASGSGTRATPTSARLA